MPVQLVYVKLIPEKNPNWPTSAGISVASQFQTNFEPTEAAELLRLLCSSQNYQPVRIYAAAALTYPCVASSARKCSLRYTKLQWIQPTTKRLLSLATASQFSPRDSYA